MKEKLSTVFKGFKRLSTVFKDFKRLSTVFKDFQRKRNYLQFSRALSETIYSFHGL